MTWILLLFVLGVAEPVQVGIDEANCKAAEQTFKAGTPAAIDYFGKRVEVIDIVCLAPDPCECSDKHESETS